MNREQYAGWTERAACLNAEDPDMFFPVAHNDPCVRDAVAMCRTCPVVFTCRLKHLGMQHGVWGGMTPQEREGYVRRFQIPEDSDTSAVLKQNGLAQVGEQSGKWVTVVDRTEYEELAAAAASEHTKAST